MPNFFALGDSLARLVLSMLPRRMANRIRQNTSPLEVYVLGSGTVKCDEPRMTLFEGVFATLLFDLALFGTSNVFINGIISLFTSIQNYWDAPFKSEGEAEEKIVEFCNRLDIQQDPWIWDAEIGRYSSLNEFFSRTYSPEHFPKIGTGRLVSPACCKILSYSNDEAMKSILIKGCDYDLARIGFPEEDLEAYGNNRVFLGYLSPKDYHRVHAPISVRVSFCLGTHALPSSFLFHLQFPSTSLKCFIRHRENVYTAKWRGRVRRVHR